MKPGRRPSPFWRHRAVAGALIVLGLNAAAFAAYTLPRLLQERSLNAQKATLAREAARADARLAALQARTELIESNTRDAERFLRETMVPREEVLLPTIQEIIGVAEELGLKLESRGTRPERVSDLPLHRFEITQPVAGSYRQIAQFLHRVEGSPRFLIVDSISISGREGGTVSLRVVFSAYYRAEEEDRGT
jgi:Tfp pilus assembly protein PilO